MSKKNRAAIGRTSYRIIKRCALQWGSQSGQAAIETLIALSMVLVASLFTMQIGLLVYEKSMVNHITFMMARSASMNYLKPDDMLKYYKKITRKFSHEESQIELCSLSADSKAARAIKVRITQGYRAPIPFAGAALKKILLAQVKMPSLFERSLLSHNLIPLHAEVSLPLPIHIPDYPATVLEFKG